MPSVMPMGEKKERKTFPYGGNSFSNNVLSHFKTGTCVILPIFVLNLIVLVNKDGKFFIKFM